MPPKGTKKVAGPGSEELRRVRDRELELKRISGEISCSDCRRLKLKCDKKIPCSSCIRRGAESLCPLGAGRSNGHSARVGLIGPSQECRREKRKLTLLSERIRALEDALAVESEARGGSGSHPLLDGELLAIKKIVHGDEAEYDDDDDDDEVDDSQMLSAFGTLSIGERRTMRYLGPAASESALLMDILETSAWQSSITASSDCLTSEIINSSRSFPFPPSFLAQNELSILAQLVTYLPPFDRATALYEAFFRNLSWFIAPVERSHFVSEVIPLFYPHRKPIEPIHMREEYAHDLALLFIVFACGSVGDLTQSPINEEADRYQTLARAAISVKSVMYGASLSGVQMLFLLGSYDVYAGRKSNMEDAWKVVTLGGNMAASIGLHRDPSRWGLEPKIVERRRRVFWEIYEIDIWRSLESGRPSTFRPNVVDCEFPNDQYATLGEDGEVIESITQWRYRFLRDIGTELCEKTCSSRPLKYRDVLDLDRRIRDFAVHPFAIRHRPHANDLGIDSEFHQLHPLITTWDKEESLMYIHRNFFARAVLDFPDNPMRSPFAASFLATYRSACTVLRICRENMQHAYLTLLRIWQVWSLCLSCGVVVGAVASLGSSVSFATSAFVELEYCISLFEKFGDHKVAKHGLPLLRRIREKAVSALRQPRIRQAQSNANDSTTQVTSFPSIRGENEGTVEELLILRGTTRVVEQRSGPSPSSSTGGDTPMDTGHSTPMTSGRPSDAANQHILQGSTNSNQSGESVLTKDNSGNALPNTSNTQGSSHLLEDYAWLAELDKLIGPSPVLQEPGTNASHYFQGQPLEWPNDYSGSSAAASNMSSTPSTSASMLQEEHHEIPTPMPDVLLDETVSTEEWRVFMQQSGFSDSPPFDFALDSVWPSAANTGQGWKSDAPIIT